MLSNPQETADLVSFSEEILNGNLHFFAQLQKLFPRKFSPYLKSMKNRHLI